MFYEKILEILKEENGDRLEIDKDIFQIIIDENNYLFIYEIIKENKRIEKEFILNYFKTSFEKKELTEQINLYKLLKKTIKNKKTLSRLEFTNLILIMNYLLNRKINYNIDKLNILNKNKFFLKAENKYITTCNLTTINMKKIKSKNKTNNIVFEDIIDLIDDEIVFLHLRDNFKNYLKTTNYSKKNIFENKMKKIEKKIEDYRNRYLYNSYMLYITDECVELAINYIDNLKIKNIKKFYTLESEKQEELNNKNVSEKTFIFLKESFLIHEIVPIAEIINKIYTNTKVENNIRQRYFEYFLKIIKEIIKEENQKTLFQEDVLKVFKKYKNLILKNNYEKNSEILHIYDTLFDKIFNEEKKKVLNTEPYSTTFYNIAYLKMFREVIEKCKKNKCDLILYEKMNLKIIIISTYLKEK